MKTFRYRFFRLFAFWIFLVFILNTLASYFYWYSTITNFDKIMHFVGGVTAAIFSVWLLYKHYDSWLKDGRIWKAFRVTMLMVLVIALLWEALEFSVQGIFRVKVLADVPDSIWDVIFGLLGAAFGHFYILRKFKKYNGK